MGPEKIIETQILNWLNYQPQIFAFKINTTGTFDPTRKVFRTIKNRHIHKGTADILGVKNGKFFAIEVKTPASYKRSFKNPAQRDLDQTRFIERVKVAQGYGIKVCTLEQVIEFIKTI